MSAEVYPVVQGQPERSNLVYDHGKPLGHFRSELARLADVLQVAPLMSFCSLSREQAIASLGQEVVEDIESGAEERDGVWQREGMTLWSREPRWFPASEGLKTVRGLLSHLRSDAGGLESSGLGGDEGVVEALQDCESLLAGAERQGLCFRFKSGL